MGEGLAATVGALEAGMGEGLHVGAQLYASVRGEVVADVAMGEARAGVVMTPRTVMLWLSSCKPVTAVAIGRLWERGLLRLDDRVADHVPEFGVGGKEAVTLGHILTHTAGFRRVETGWPEVAWEQSIARICAAPQERGWTPGEKAGYSPYTSWFILGEIVRRLDGREVERYVREEIFLPLGMNDSWLAVSPQQYRELGAKLGIMQKLQAGRWVDADLDTEPACTRCRPAGSGHGPARELGRFYEMLLNGGAWGDARILSPQTVEAMTARRRAGWHDATFNHVMDWGLGFLLRPQSYSPTGLTSPQPPRSAPYAYGPHASVRAYGHGGNQSSVGFADPEHGLAVGLIFNGMPGEPAHQRRLHAALAAIYEDLRLVPTT